MNIGAIAMTEGFNTLADVQGTTFQIIGTGAQFTGTLNEVPAIDPEWELGSDLRSLSTLETNNAPNGIDLNARLGVVVSGVLSGTIWKVVKADLNPADFASMFWVVQVTSSDQ